MNFKITEYDGSGIQSRETTSSPKNTEYDGSYIYTEEVLSMMGVIYTEEVLRMMGVMRKLENIDQ